MTDRILIEKLKIEKKKWENQIYGVGETRIDLMIDDVIRELQTQQEEIESLKYRKERQLKRFSKYKENIENKHEEIYEDLVQELEKKDAVIDEMAKYLYEDDNIFGFGNLKEINTPEKIEEYFINKCKGE